ncbi:MAG: DNA mismatch repair endonuclease MutL, partial [Oscillospiraceae bacterium]
MSHINVLPKNVSELIAAGEVVDRPSSLVKELVENSIDAGADKIIVEIKNGGIAFISVSDNGCGMEKEDIPKAFIRHATSKIISCEDLDKIGTMGFRGEALPSAAAVAHVTVVSKTENQENGWFFDTFTGEISPVGAINGTTVTVTELFYNTPARMKFLKRDVTEGNAVETLLQRMCLSNPHIAFTFIREGKEKIKTNGDGELKLTVRAVFGSEMARGMLPLSRESDGIKVEGLVMAPEFSKNSRSLQVFFINNRLINSNTCRSALEEAYKNRITVGKFPAGIINLTMDFSLVDVNVHPAKLEVRFQNEREVYNALYSAVLETLQGRDNSQNPKISKINVFSLKDFDYKNEQVSIKEAPKSLCLRDGTAFNSKGEILVKPMGRMNYFDVDIEVDENFHKNPPAEEQEKGEETKIPKINTPIEKATEVI